MFVQIEEILNKARMYLNDANQQLWTDVVLMPMLQRAFSELQTTLKQRAAPIMKTSVVDIIPPGITVFPAVIQDLVSPINIYEQVPGVLSTRTLMTEYDPLPDVAPVATLNFWNWDGANVLFIGATTAREVQLYYWRTLNLPTDPTAGLQIVEGEMWLAPRTAALAARSVGEENTANQAANDAKEFLEMVILANRGRSPQMQGAAVRP